MIDLFEAKRLANKIVIGRYENPPVRILDIAEEAGFKVMECDVKDYPFSAIMDIVNKIIFVSHVDSVEKKRFSIAYELGLWYNFREEIEKDPAHMIFKHQSALLKRNDIEAICYQFAADILVPDDLLQKFTEKLSIAELEIMFCVETKVICEKV